MELFTPLIKSRIHIDEKCVKVGPEQNYDLNAIDSKTKYVHAHLFVKRRTLGEVVLFLRGNCSILCGVLAISDATFDDNGFGTCGFTTSY